MSLATAFSQLTDLYNAFLGFLTGNFYQFFNQSLRWWPLFFAFAFFLLLTLIRGIISIFNDL